jgi:hypothetical protein
MLWFTMLVVTAIAAISWIVIRRRVAKAKHLPLAPALTAGEQKNSGQSEVGEVQRVFIIEHVPAQMRRLDIGGFEVSAMVQVELLLASTVLVKKLPPYVRDFLSSPVFSSPVLANFSRMLSQGEGLEDISPERVRVTVAVAVVSLSLQDMMTWFGNKIGAPDPLILERHTGVIRTSIRFFHVEDIILQMMLSAGVSHDTAMEMWLGILSIMQNGNINIPGIKARLPAEGESF